MLKDAYAEPPFRVGHCFPEGSALHMIMASSAPGMFGGDDFRQSIHVESGARVRLTSQSATQVHPSADGGVARLRTMYDVADGASLSCHWDPLIPFADASFDQRIDVRLAGDASLYWSDAFMAGRQASGECWKFQALAHELRVSRGDSLEYLERYRIAPVERAVDHSWIARGACYFGTTLASGPVANADGAAQLHAELEKIADVSAAVDTLDPRLLLVRLMSATGVSFHEARAATRESLGACGSGPKA